MPTSHSALTTSIIYPRFLGYLENWWRTSSLHHVLPSLASYRTSQHILSRSHRRRKRSTWQLSGIGRSSLHTPYGKSRSFMGSSYMPFLSSQQDELTLFLSKPCCPFFMTICTCLIPLPSIQVRTSAGGKPASHSSSSLVPSQGPLTLLTPWLTQTLVQALASWFGSAADGKHDISS